MNAKQTLLSCFGYLYYLLICSLLSPFHQQEPGASSEPVLLPVLMALFHCMVWHGTVQYGSLLGGFPLGTVPGTFFSTTSAVVPSENRHCLHH